MNILHRLPKWLPGFVIFLQIADKKAFLQKRFLYIRSSNLPGFLPSGLEQEDWVETSAG
jgi:hypothetical protein